MFIIHVFTQRKAETGYTYGYNHTIFANTIIYTECAVKCLAQCSKPLSFPDGGGDVVSLPVCDGYIYIYIHTYIYVQTGPSTQQN